MLALNISALLIDNLFGVFGPFHWMALASLVTLITDVAAVLIRWPKKEWVAWHGGLLAGSYVGLVAATASEGVALVSTNATPSETRSSGLASTSQLASAGFACQATCLTGANNDGAVRPRCDENPSRLRVFV